MRETSARQNQSPHETPAAGLTLSCQLALLYPSPTSRQPLTGTLLLIWRALATPSIPSIKELQTQHPVDSVSRAIWVAHPFTRRSCLLSLPLSLLLLNLVTFSQPKSLLHALLWLTLVTLIQPKSCSSPLHLNCFTRW